MRGMQGRREMNYREQRKKEGKKKEGKKKKERKKGRKESKERKEKKEEGKEGGRLAMACLAVAGGCRRWPNWAAKAQAQAKVVQV